MTDEQRQKYERDKEEAQAVYERLMMESNAAVIRARAPFAPAAPAKQTSPIRYVAWMGKFLKIGVKT